MITYDSSIITLTILTALAFIAVYALKAVVMIIPAPALYIAAGLYFPIEWAIIVTYLGLLTSLSIGYFNGKMLGEKRVSELIAKHKRAAIFIESRQDSLPSLCFISRITPLPKDLFSMLYGALGMPFSKYIFISLMGISPVMIPYVIAGSYIATPLSPEFLVPFSASLIITLVIFFIYKRQTGIKKAATPD